MDHLNTSLTHLKSDPVLATLISRFGKLNYQPNQDRFSSLAGEIIGQQLSGKVADVIWGRFEKLCNGQVSPGKILSLTREQLRSVGMSWAKASSVLDLANKATDGTLQLNKLDKMTDEEVVEHLVRVKGIGRWTAEMSLMFTLQRPDVLPLDDVGIQNAFVKHYGLRRSSKLLKTKMLKIAEKWRPYRTIACWYLWKSLDNRPEKD